MRSLAMVGTCVCVLLAGCASPGSPLPPSLLLPERVKNLQAGREGHAVRLQWTTPTRTTDGLLLNGEKQSYIRKRKDKQNTALVAEICRGTSAAAAATCIPVARLTVVPGQAATYENTLPAALQQGPADLLAYRVRILNAAGRDAGWSVAAFTAAGAAPSPMVQVQVRAVRSGVELQWPPDHKTQNGDAVSIERQSLLPGKSKPAISTLQVTGSPDAGGAVDDGATPGSALTYTVMRTRIVKLDGHTLELHGEPFRVVANNVIADFPPPVPGGLEAVAVPPGTNQKAAIDLSWEPVDDANLKGYVVYRSIRKAGGGGNWSNIAQVPATVPAYHDAAVEAGIEYQYRVSAVSGNGRESAPGRPTRMTATGVE